VEQWPSVSIFGTTKHYTKAKFKNSRKHISPVTRRQNKPAGNFLQSPRFRSFTVAERPSLEFSPFLPSALSVCVSDLAISERVLHHVPRGHVSAVSVNSITVWGYQKGLLLRLELPTQVLTGPALRLLPACFPFPFSCCMAAYRGSRGDWRALQWPPLLYEKC
jgi:hypothetical protein